MAHLLASRRAATVGVLVLVASPFAGLSAAQASFAPHPSAAVSSTALTPLQQAPREPHPRPHRLAATPTTYAVPAQQRDSVVLRAGTAATSLV